MSTILVTGGAGHIGSRDRKALARARAGYSPVAYDNLVYGHREAALLRVGHFSLDSRIPAII
jgi:UDP-glucose 4-epimerase